jgi:chromate transporter
MGEGEPSVEQARGTAGEVLLAFLKLGLTSFGGPIAHIGYFHNEFVLRRRWLSERDFGQLVALCQFLPGPASSQVSFALGLMRAGAAGAAAAWAGFTLPSAALMIAFAYGARFLSGPLGDSLIHGLKLGAVAIVAQALFGMARSLTPDARRAGIAVAALALVILAGGALGQIGAILLGAVAGLLFCDSGADGAAAGPERPVFSRAGGLAFLALFLVLLAGLPLLSASGAGPAVSLFDAFYRAGALVFGGGHVVLPLLEAAVVPPGWIDDGAFLAGYGAAQAMPGPLFTFAAYLGAAMTLAPGGIVGGVIALVAIFAPGLLILLAALPFWHALQRQPGARAALAGTNAAVVGVLAAAFHDPVWTGAVLSPRDFLVAAAGFVALVAWKRPPWQVLVAMLVAVFLLRLV